MARLCHARIILRACLGIVPINRAYEKSIRLYKIDLLGPVNDRDQIWSDLFIYTPTL